MSRCSTPSVDTTESVDDDPLMRDCFELRRRLILTEKSLKNLNPPRLKETDVPERAANNSAVNAALDSVPPLKLDDLSLDSSRRSNHATDKDHLLPPGRSFSYPDLYNESVEKRSEAALKSPGSVTEAKPGSPSTGLFALRTKLSTVRDENIHLFSQNHLLLTQLEDKSYQLSQSQAKIKMQESSIEKYRLERTHFLEKIADLQQEITENTSQMRHLLKNEELLNKTISAKDEEMKRLTSVVREIEDDYRAELQHRESIEGKLEESLQAGEQMKQKLIDVREHMQVEVRLHNESEKRAEQQLNDWEKERDILRDRILQLEEDFTQTQDAFREENDALRSSLNMENDLVNQLKESLRDSEDTKEDNRHLKNLLREKEAKIHEYEKEVQGAKEHMLKLETLVQRVQENAMKEQLTNHDISTGSSITDHYENEDMFLDSSPNRTKAAIADLKMKLAKKDAEIQKLQASLTARSAAHQKSIAGLDELSAGSMHGLRSELTAVVERNRIGDKRQQELEKVITRLEDDLSGYSNQIMVLEERLADKMAQISSLEGKVSQKNLKITSLQTELEKKYEGASEAEKELHQKEMNNRNLENDLKTSQGKLSEYVAQLRDMELKLNDLMGKNNELQELIQMKSTEKKQATSLVEKVKQLHTDQCRDFEQQIELLQQRLETKTLQLTSLETNFTAVKRELEMKTSFCQDLQLNLEQSRRNLEERSLLLLQHEKKLKTLQEQMVQETAQVENLELSLSHCKDELNAILKQAEDDKENSKSEIINKQAEMQQLRDMMEKAKTELDGKTIELVNIKKSLKGRDDMLFESQKRITELEEYQDKTHEEQARVINQSAREKNAINEELDKLKSDLSRSNTKISSKSKHIDELEAALNEVHSELRLNIDKVTELENALQNSKKDIECNRARHKELENDLKEKSSKIKELLATNKDLETKLHEAEDRYNQETTTVSKLDNELQAVQKELNQTIEDLAMLQQLLHDNQKEIQKKEEEVSKLDRKLNESHEEMQQKDLELQEQQQKLTWMDKLMKEHKMELKQRAVEVTQLDMTFKEQQSELQQKFVTAEHNLIKTNQELSHKMTENAELLAKLDQADSKLNEKKTQLEQLKNTLKNQESITKENSFKLSAMQEELRKYSRKEETALYMEQEFRLAKEQEQRLLDELHSLRQELLKVQRNETELGEELENCHMLLTSKEADCTRLARDLGASQVREAQKESKFTQEILQIKQQLEFKIKQTEQEAENAQEKQSKRFVSQEQELSKVKLSFQRITDENKLLMHDLERSQQRVGEQEEDLKSLSRLLQLEQQQVKDLNEHALIKEAEITRLEARISGYERATFGFRSAGERTLSTPKRGSASNQRSPPPQRPSSATPNLGLTKSGIETQKNSSFNKQLVPSLFSTSQLIDTNFTHDSYYNI